MGLWLSKKLFRKKPGFFLFSCGRAYLEMCIDSGELPVYCTLSCDEGFAFAFQPMSDYFCPINQTILADYYDENFTEDEMMDAADYVELIMAGRVCLRIVSFSTLLEEPYLKGSRRSPPLHFG